MANAHGVMMMVFDMAHLMAMRRSLGSERREQRGATNDSEKTGDSFGNGVHSL